MSESSAASAGASAKPASPRAASGHAHGADEHGHGEGDAKKALTGVERQIEEQVRSSASARTARRRPPPARGEPRVQGRARLRRGRVTVRRAALAQSTPSRARAELLALRARRFFRHCSLRWPRPQPHPRPHPSPPQVVAAKAANHKTGLTPEVVLERRKVHGLNQLPEKPRNLLLIFLSYCESARSPEARAPAPDANTLTPPPLHNLRPPPRSLRSRSRVVRASQSWARCRQ